MIENFWNSEEVNLNNIELSEDDKKIIEKWVLIQSIMDGMVNKFKTFDIKTVRDIRLILELLDNKEDYKVYNSNFNLKYSETAEDMNLFEPVDVVLPEDNCSAYSWRDVEAISVNEFLKKLVLCKQDRGLEGDVDDGFVYKDYENLIIRYDLKIIILL